MPYVTFSTFVNAPFKIVWNLLLDKVENPKRYIKEVEDFKILERSKDGVLREMKALGMTIKERITVDEEAGEVQFTLVDHPLFTGQTLNKIVLPVSKNPHEPLTLTFTMDWEPSNQEAQKIAQQELAQALQDAVLDTKTIAESSQKNVTTSDRANFDTFFDHHTASVNGVRLHYVMGGKGDPVVLLHGCFQTWCEWRKIMPTLAKYYTVIAPDMRGIGDSTKPIAGYDQRTLAEDIYQLVSQLGFKRIFLVGHDFGGAVAYAYAVDHPENVRRFAFLDYVLSGFGFEEAMIPRRDGKSLWVAALHVVRDIPEVLVAGKERFYLSQIFRGQFAYNPYAISEADIDEYTSRYSAPGGLRGLFEYYRATWENADQNKENAKRKLTMPVLALGGDCSLGENVMLSMKAVAEDVRGGVVERCGHWIPDERPDYITEQLLAFFGEEKSL